MGLASRHIHTGTDTHVYYIVTKLLTSFIIVELDPFLDLPNCRNLLCQNHLWLKFVSIDLAIDNIHILSPSCVLYYYNLKNGGVVLSISYAGVGKASNNSKYARTILVQQQCKHTSCFLAFTCVRVAQDYSLSFFLINVFKLVQYTLSQC